MAMMLGWNRWDVGVKDSDILRIKGEVKKNKSNSKNFGKKTFQKDFGTKQF